MQLNEFIKYMQNHDNRDNNDFTTINFQRSKPTDPIIDDEGAEKIAKVLIYCPQNMEIHLGSNDIGDKGAASFAMQIEEGQYPQGLKLDLVANTIGDEGAKAIAQALQENEGPGGLEVNLGYNKIKKEGKEALLEALQKNTTIVDIQLNNNNCPPLKNEAQIITHCCLRNRLIANYPQYEEYIKSVSRAHGLYKGAMSAAPLKQMTSFLVSKPETFKLESLPQDLQDYIKTFSELSTQLSSPAPGKK